MLGAPDIYEQPFHQLDVVASQALPGQLSLTLKAQNLLDLPAAHTQGGQITERVQRGRAWSIGVDMSF